MGKRFVKICNSLFPGASRAYIAEHLGTSNEGRIRLFEQGSMPETAVLNALDRMGVSLEWFLINKGKMLRDDTSPTQTEKQEQENGAATLIATIPTPNAIRRKGDQDETHKILRLRTVGNAAALQTGTSQRSGFNDEALLWDDIEVIPESTHLVKVRGDSMEPLMMHGQSVMVGTEYRVELGDVPRNRDIVVAEVTVQDNDIGGEDSGWEGVHVKRIQDGGDFWIFTSINPSGATFSVAKENCRLWHVIGVYFGEKSAIPKGD